MYIVVILPDDGPNGQNILQIANEYIVF